MGHPDLVVVETELTRYELSPGGLMALAGGPGPDYHRGAGIRIDPHQPRTRKRRRQPVRRPRKAQTGEGGGAKPTHFDVARKPEADMPALGSRLIALGPQVGVGRTVDQGLEVGFVGLVSSWNPTGAIAFGKSDSGMKFFSRTSAASMPISRA